MAVDNLPLYEIIPRKNHVKKATEVTLLCLLISLLIYRLMHLKDGGFIWFLAFLCESWFTFIWALVVNIKWTPVLYKTYPQRLLQRKIELPPVDMFVTTADPELEPPIITVNTVLSLMAMDYPEDKLACYVSDDGCSPVTYFALVEAAKFAKLWVPFCKKYDIPVRVPFRYFSGDGIKPLDGDVNGSLEFQQAWKAMKVNIITYIPMNMKK